MGCAASKPAVREPASDSVEEPPQAQPAVKAEAPQPQPQPAEPQPAEAQPAPKQNGTDPNGKAAAPVAEARPNPFAAAAQTAAPAASAFANGNSSLRPAGEGCAAGAPADSPVSCGASPTAGRPPPGCGAKPKPPRSRWPPDRGLEAGAETPFEMGRAASAPLPQDLGFMSAPLPPNETERLADLCSLNVLDTPRESRFDDITSLLCQIFDVKIANVSLIDGRRQWWKSSTMQPPVRELDRSSAFCAWTLLPAHHEVLVVPDALQDIRFADNPLVRGHPFIRFYAGAPLVSSTGFRLGSLCVIDTRPRQLEPESCTVLINFAEVVVRELEKERMKGLEAERAESRRTGLLRAFDAFSEGLMVCASDSPELPILFFNDEWARMTGMERSALGCSVWDLFEISEKKEAMLTLARHAVAARKAFCLDFARAGPDGRPGRFTASFRPVSSATLDRQAPEVAIPTTMAGEAADGVKDDLYFCTISERQPPTPGSSSLASTGSLAFRDEPVREPKHPFDDVQLGPLLGQGSFGKVFRGIWNGAQVAVKIIQPPPSPRDSPAAADLSSGGGGGGNSRADFEALLTAQLAHPHIVATLKSARVPVQAELGARAPAHETWLVLEYCECGTLQYAIERGRFDAGFVADGRRSQRPHLPAIRATALEVAQAMAYLHAHDILHGDLTGGNILLAAASADDGSQRGFTAKVADFGLARSLDAEQVMTQTFGTVTHMPPELLTAGHLSKAADSYAFGIILWELFSGTRPWAGMLPMQVIYHVTILGKRIQFPDTTPPAFRALGEACLKAEPSERPTFAQIVETLSAL